LVGRSGSPKPGAAAARKGRRFFWVGQSRYSMSIMAGTPGTNSASLPSNPAWP